MDTVLITIDSFYALNRKGVPAFEKIVKDGIVYEPFTDYDENGKQFLFIPTSVNGELMYQKIPEYLISRLAGSNSCW